MEFPDPGDPASYYSAAQASTPARFKQLWIPQKIDQKVLIRESTRAAPVTARRLRPLYNIVQH